MNTKITLHLDCACIFEQIALIFYIYIIILICFSSNAVNWFKKINHDKTLNVCQALYFKDKYLL